jgi:hypothetical protein
MVAPVMANYNSATRQDAVHNAVVCRKVSRMPSQYLTSRR